MAWRLLVIAEVTRVWDDPLVVCFGGDPLHCSAGCPGLVVLGVGGGLDV